MPRITENELKVHIKSKHFERLYFLYGEETYLKQHYSKQIVGAVVEPSLEAFNLQSFNGREASMEDVISAVMAMPVMSERKCVVLCDFDAEAAKADSLQGFKDLLGNPAQDCVLVVWFDSVQVNIKSSSKWKSILAIVQKTGCAVELSPKSDAEIIRTLMGGAKRRGCEMSYEAAELLIDTSGKDLQLLQMELQKLCSFAGSGVIDESAVRQLAVNNAEASSFEMANAVVDGNADKAYRLLDELYIMRAEPVMISSALAACYVDLYRVKAAMESGGKAQDIADFYDYKRKEFRLKNAARTAAHRKIPDLRRAVELLLEVDIKLKSAKIDNRIILEQLISQLCNI